MKHCPKCGETKPTAKFYKNRTTATGLTSWCKACTNEVNRRWEAKNRERQREASRRYRATNRERETDRGRRWRVKNMTPARVSWSSMLERCGNPKTSGYKYYGGRGIAVCVRWDPKHQSAPNEAFANFLTDMGERPEGSSLDRIDNDGNYEPDNCRWATFRKQTANRNKVTVYPPRSENATHCPTCRCTADQKAAKKERK